MLRVRVECEHQQRGGGETSVCDGSLRAYDEDDDDAMVFLYAHTLVELVVSAPPIGRAHRVRGMKRGN